MTVTKLMVYEIAPARAATFSAARADLATVVSRLAGYRGQRHLTSVDAGGLAVDLSEWTDPDAAAQAFQHLSQAPDTVAFRAHVARVLCSARLVPGPGWQ